MHFSEMPMYKIVKEPFGFELTFGDTVSADELKHWRLESVRALVGAPESFGVIFDLRTLRRNELDPEAQEMLAEGRELFMRAGMRRSCIILDSAPITARYRRQAWETRGRSFERYLNAAADPGWRAKAVAWIEQQIDPY